MVGKANVFKNRLLCGCRQIYSLNNRICSLLIFERQNRDSWSLASTGRASFVGGYRQPW